MTMPLIGYTDDASESWCNAINALAGLNAEVTLHNGEVFDAEIVGSGVDPGPGYLYGLSFKRLGEDEFAELGPKEFVNCDDLAGIIIY